MSEIKTGGPAFPRPHSGASQFAQEGMTLRDYFAAKAMQNFLIDPTLDIKTTTSVDIAKLSYALADAMLKVREQ